MTEGQDRCAGRADHSDLKEQLGSEKEIKNNEKKSTPKKKSKGSKKSKKPEEESRVVKDFRGEERVINQRHRLRRVEIEILEAEFLKDSSWTLTQSKALAH